MDLNIGKKIKQLRTMHNISQEELAKHICVTRQTITNYENMSSQPDLETLKNIALFFNVTSDFLLSIENEDLPQEQFLEKLLYYGRKLNITNRDIIIGTMASMLKEQQIELSTKEKEIG